MSSAIPHEDAESVRQFFDQWDLYKKVVAANRLFHREAYQAFSAALDRFHAPISFIDLGAGDAEWTSRILAGRKVRAYEAVDLSAVALELARENLAALPCPKRLTQADFAAFVRESGQTADVVFVGLSFHHLPLADKRPFLSEVRRMTAEGGGFFFYEPIRRRDEDRERGLARWWAESVLRDWVEFSAEELRQIHDHCFNSDFPEPLESYDQIAREAGFRGTKVHYVSPGEFYAVVECLR